MHVFLNPRDRRIEGASAVVLANTGSPNPIRPNQSKAQVLDRGPEADRGFRELKVYRGNGHSQRSYPNSIASHQPTKRKRFMDMLGKKKDRSPRVRRIARIARIAACAGVRSSSSVTSCLMTAQSGNCRFCVRACFRPRWYLPMALCHNQISGPQTIARRLAPRQECSWIGLWLEAWTR